MANSWVNSRWGKLFAIVKGQKIHRAKITLFTVYHLIMRYIGRTKTMISQVPINTTLSHTFLCQSFSVFPGVTSWFWALPAVCPGSFSSALALPSAGWCTAAVFSQSPAPSLVSCALFPFLLTSSLTFLLPPSCCSKPFLVALLFYLFLKKFDLVLQ